MLIQNIEKWLIGDMGTPGEYMYQAIHGYSLVAVGILTVLLSVIQYRNRTNGQACRQMIIGVSIFQIVFEIAWRLIYLFIKGDSVLCWWPTYPCNLGGVLIPIIALLNLKTGKKLFYLFGFVGAILTFALPQGIFSSDVLVFPILKSILQHTGILLIPLLEYISSSYRPTLKHMGWVIAGCLIHVVNCEGIDRLLGFTGDYMFFRSGMPFVIPGVPQFITMSVFALLVLSLLSFLCDIRGSVAFLKTLRKK